MLHGLGVTRLWPNQGTGEQRSSNTGSNRTRSPRGNSTKQHACPSQVARRLVMLSRSDRNFGLVTEIVVASVSGLWLLLERNLCLYR